MLTGTGRSGMQIGDKCFGSIRALGARGAGSTPASPKLGLDNRQEVG